MHLPSRSFLPRLIALALLSTSLHMQAADGPTPYPDAKAEASWPGQGPIRVQGWMVDNRRAFWTQRARDQKAVVFVGDSLTGGWKAEAMAQAFPGMKIANRGIGGDVSRGVLFRFQEDVLDLHPTAIVLLVGTNDLSTHADPAVVEKNIAAILSAARAAEPTLPIVLCQIPPRDVKDAPTKPGALPDLNARIAKLGKSLPNLEVVDLFTPMAQGDGKPKPELFAADKIHLAPAGYHLWAEALRPAFAKLGIK